METKKNPRKDVYRLTNIWFNVGLILSLTAVITAFEWRSTVEPPTIDEKDLFTGQELDVIIPTKIDPPPKPKPILPQPVESVDEEIEVEDIEDLSFDIGEIDVPEPPELEGKPRVEKPDEIFDIVEEQPEPVGGYEAFYKFISKNIKYPGQAKSIGIEGRVSVQFVVDEEGNITNIEILRGIGAGCDEEVIRLMEKAPKWKPGKQRAVPVKVRMVIPVVFKLN